MKNNIVETLMGAVVLLVAGIFVMISYNSGNVNSPDDGYVVSAKFREIGTLSVGSDVRVGGIKVGSVSGQSLDPESYMAKVEISLNNSVKLPTDSSASIVSDGLLGGKYITIQPGADSKYMKDGSVISYTQDAINFESLIGKFAFGGIDDSNETEDSLGF